MVLLTDSEPNLTIGEPNREIRSQIIQVERERERERERDRHGWCNQWATNGAEWLNLWIEAGR